MQDLDDLTLLREYAAHDSEAAFAELVARRVGFVYSAALRQVRDPHLAEEITQAVFIILAQKAGRISDKTILCGWLFKTTRYAAIAQTRDAAKRSLRTATIEKEFQMQNEIQATAPDALWEQMSPLLDEALATLGETDRQALLLRFFENKSLAEVGSHLGTGEDTARKRVARALEKLHRYFNKRGVNSTTAILAGAISANSVQAAPVTLAKTVTAVAIAKGAAASTSTLTLIKGALKIMAWQKMKTTVLVGTVMIMAAGAVALAPQNKAQENSLSIPYKMADDLWQLVGRVDKTKLIVQIAFNSMDKAAKTSEIQIIIHSAVQGSITVPLDTNGLVTDFPHTERLREENPTVTINHPGGMLNFNVWSYMPIQASRSFRYDQLGDGVAETIGVIAQANKILVRPSYIGWINYVDSLFSSSWKFKVQGVTFVFPKTSARKATIEIMSVTGTKKYQADANGEIKLKLNKSLLSENPEVKVSENPLFIGPDLQLN
jgi:RNA polymerase sigma factor (sigma-70 family)